MFTRINKSTLNDMKHRGAFIVFEGVDRCGKSTQCRNLVAKLNANNNPAELICFPDRKTCIGGLIDEYLSKRKDLSDQAIHLLFSANRWELEPVMRKHLLNGVTLIVDRYSFSGVAYSAAKSTNYLDMQWFKNPDTGLPKPDCVFYLNIEEHVIKKRKDFGEERYENCQFQKEVKKRYDLLKDDTWKIIDANKTIDDLTNELYLATVKVIEKSRNQPISTLW